MNAPQSPALEALRARAPNARPRIAVVLGSGWGALTDHVADAVRYMAGLPLSANVLNLTVMASGMPFVGRG